MKATTSLTLVPLAALLPFAISAQSFNLANDWSNVSNPNGPWSYVVGGTTPSSPVVIGGTQLSWGGIPGWFKADGTYPDSWDWQTGDVVTHTPVQGFGSSEIRWTSPVAGDFDLQGGIWATREFGRHNDWTISLNGVPLTGGTVGDGDPYDRATPFLFSTGSGGSGAIANLSLNSGDVIALTVSASPIGAGNDDYAGVSLIISPTPVPEPETLAIVGALGLFAFAAIRRISR